MTGGAPEELTFPVGGSVLCLEWREAAGALLGPGCLISSGSNQTVGEGLL